MSKDIFEIINPTNTLGVCRPLAHILGACETIVYNALLSKYRYYQKNDMLLGANQTNADGALCGNGYMVAAARGHLLRNKTPDEYEEYKKWDLSVLPIIPDFEFVPIEKNIDVLHTLAKLMNSREIDEIIEATDAGREGECIFRYIYNYVGCKKPVCGIGNSWLKQNC